MGQSLIRYSAVVCVVAGGLFVGGTGAVAFADEPADGSAPGPVVDDTAEPASAPEPTASLRRFQLPKWLQFPGLNPSGTEPKVGVILPPVMNLPAHLESTTTPDGPTAVRAPTITLPFVIDSVTQPDRQLPAAVLAPAGSQAAGAADAAPASDDRKPAASTRFTPPTVDLTPLVPRSVQGQPVTIKNPLRALLPEDLDLHQPLAKQLLPPPLYMLLANVAQQIPLAGLVISPLLEFVAPPLLADVVIPMLLSDIVVPTISFDAWLPEPWSTPLPMAKPEPFPLAGISSPPPELAPMGMDSDVVQAPVLPGGPAPALGPFVVEKPQAPNPPPGDTIDPLAATEFRAGYSDYLRNAGLAQITAIAVPGAVAILLFTAGGGFIGYRQARAGHVIRAEGISRFLR